MVCDTSPQLGGNLDVQARLLVGACGSNGIAIANGGEVTMAKQSAFFYKLSSSDANRTGDGTLYTLGTDHDLTKLIDQQCEVTVCSGAFTPTVAGLYMLGGSLNILGSSLCTTNNDNFMIQIVTTCETLIYAGDLVANYADSASIGVAMVHISGLVAMAACNTALLKFQVYDNSGSNCNSIDIEAGNNSSFWGYKVA